jgi:hypothetical protein
MHITPGRMRRTGITLLTTLALLVPAAATVAFTAAPALAATPGSSSSDTGGSQGTDDDPKGGGNDSNPGYYCDYNKGDLLRKSPKGNFVWTTMQGQCQKGKAGNVTWKYNGTIKLCPVGFQVFRFYGTGSAAAKGWSTSILNQSSWCLSASEQKNKMYTFWSTSGYDVNPGLSSSTAYSQNTGVETGVRYAGKSANGAEENIRFGPTWTATNTSNNAPGKAFDGNKNCVAMMNKTNPIRAYLNVDLPSKTGQQVALQLKSSFDSVQRSQGVEAAKKETGIAAFSMSGNGKKVNNITWLNPNCSSPMMYVSTNKSGDNSAKGLAAQRYTGACYIPLERQVRVFQKIGSSSKTDSFDTASAGYGLRYSNLYNESKHAAYTKAEPRGVQGGKATTAEKRILNQWRAHMESWYSNKVSPRYDGTQPGNEWDFLNDGGKYQAIPADPYNVKSDRKPVKSAQKYDRDKAVKALRDWSKCRFGTNYEFQSTSTEGTGDDVNTRIDLRMDNVPVFQAGGYARPGVRTQQISVTPSALSCVGVDCASANPTLASLAYDVDVAMPGYTLCNGTNAGTCDYEVAKVERGGGVLGCTATADGCTVRVNGVTTTPLTVTFNFFTPTSSADKIAVAVSGVAAEYDWSSGARQMTVTLIDSTTGKVKTKAIEIADERKRSEVHTIGVSGAPVPLTPDGSGGYVFRAPVIGAVASR